MRRIQGLKRLKERKVVPYVFCDQSKLSEGSIEMNASVEMTHSAFWDFDHVKDAEFDSC